MKHSLATVHRSLIPNDQVGDWRIQADGSIDVFSGETGNGDSDFLIQLHELFEAHMCRRDGVKESDVDAFDAVYTGPFEEPGHDENAPYHVQHEAAMKLEQYAAHLLGVPWRKHEKRIDALFEKK